VEALEGIGWSLRSSHVAGGIVTAGVAAQPANTTAHVQAKRISVAYGRRGEMMEALVREYFAHNK
jgi:hypothetical protein